MDNTLEIFGIQNYCSLVDDISQNFYGKVGFFCPHFMDLNSSLFLSRLWIHQRDIGEQVSQKNSKKGGLLLGQVRVITLIYVYGMRASQKVKHSDRLLSNIGDHDVKQ